MSYAGMATQVVGGELQGWAAVLSKWEMQRQFREEMARQQAAAQAALGDFNTRLPQFGSDEANKQLASGVQARMGKYDEAGKVPLGFSLKGKENIPATATASANVTGRARAGMGTYGDWAHNTGQASTEQGRALNQTLNFAGGNAQVFPYRMYEAQHSQDAMAMIGQAISSLGGGGSNFSQFTQQPQGRQGGQPQMGGFTDSYGTYWPTGWTNMGGGYEGTLIPG